MADKTIGQLPELAEITDTSLLPVEQSGTAYHAMGSTWKNYVRAAAADEIANAETAADTAVDAAASAEAAAASAAADKTAIQGMTVSSTVLEAGATPTLSKTESGGVWTLNFGLAPGAVGSQGIQGPAGPQGVQGPAGPAGGNAASVEAASGIFSFAVNPQGHLIMTYAGGETNPDAWYIDFDTDSPTYGHLFYDPDLE